MKRSQSIIICMAVFLLTASLALGADSRPVQPKANDKCPVCGMFVAKYREWVAQIVFKDGSYAVFDGPKDMFKYYLDPAKYNHAKKQADIKALYVTEYYSTKVMDARKMFYVLGSDVMGPMGAELVPVDSEKGAREFMKDHAGKRILKFPEVTTGVLE